MTRVTLDDPFVKDEVKKIEELVKTVRSSLSVRWVGSFVRPLTHPDGEVFYLAAIWCNEKYPSVMGNYEIQILPVL